MHIPNSLKQFGIEQAIDYITKDPEKNLPTLMTWVDKFSRGVFPPSGPLCVTRSPTRTTPTTSSSSTL